jgi:hypothetical protein
MVLLTHMHGDHVGDLKLKAPGEGTCANSARVPAPNSTTAEVVAAKNAALVTTRAMAGFVHNKVRAMRAGDGSTPMDFCANLSVTVPVPAACSSRIDLGGVFVAKTADAPQGVEITIVCSAHVNNVPPALLTKPQRDALNADGAQLEYGPAVGLVVKFTNGLVAYLSSDTAIHAEMKTVVNEFHEASLAVLNLGANPGIFISGAHAMNELVKPASVILTHVNEPATERGKAAAFVADGAADQAAQGARCSRKGIISHRGSGGCAGCWDSPLRRFQTRGGSRSCLSTSVTLARTCARLSSPAAWTFRAPIP